MVLAVILLPCVAGLLHAQQESASSGRFYRLNPTPKTVEWRYYEPKTPPVLPINSGDKVEIQTLVASTPERFASAGISDDRIEPAMLEIFRQVESGARRSHSHRPDLCRGSRCRGELATPPLRRFVKPDSDRLQMTATSL